MIKWIAIINGAKKKCKYEILNESDESIVFVMKENGLFIIHWWLVIPTEIKCVIGNQQLYMTQMACIIHCHVNIIIPDMWIDVNRKCYKIQMFLVFYQSKTTFCFQLF